ncbi:MAG: sulfate adenylyltransferase subunit 1 [Hyphomicrobiaceae bacterium]
MTAATALKQEDVHEIRPDLSTLRDLNSSLRILTCGSVDDGKSTLIGRVLWDATDLYDDQREAIGKSKAGDGTHPDFSQLLDGLAAEREQGITIDIAWRYFEAGDRRYIIIDSPGHEQYTRNMASGASHADVAIMLVDARHGVKEQTRRHAAILDLMGLKRVILAVNKMDLVDWSEEKFREIEEEFFSITKSFEFENPVAIPVSAVVGDNVAEASQNMPWYGGKTLLAYLEAQSEAVAELTQSFRMPVQMVIREGQDFRGLAGTVTSGRVAIGDEVADAVSGRTARIKRIATMDGDLQEAAVGRAIVMELDTDVDVSRGAIISSVDDKPMPVTKLAARLVWLGEKPYKATSQYLLRTATDLVPIDWLQIKTLLDLTTLTPRDKGACEANDIADVNITLGRATALDVFRDHSGTGNFMIVDSVTGASVAGGVAMEVSDHGVVDGIAPFTIASDCAFTLTRALLDEGICRDLVGKTDSGSQAEYQRRAEEVAKLMRAAGVDVCLE